MKIAKIAAVVLIILSFAVFAYAVQPDNITFTPIRHATMVIQSGDLTIYVDPVGEPGTFGELPDPDVILITDIHYDHLAPDMVASLKTDDTVIIGPAAVIEQLGYGTVINYGENRVYDKFIVEGIPAYNLTPERVNYHENGRGNGYILTIDGERIYISGDTEDIPEMRALENIDHAFVCMNLPYTMTVDQAASAVLEFKPEIIYPYHFRGKDMISDLDEFKRIVGEDPDIKVEVLEWYPPEAKNIKE